MLGGYQICFIVWFSILGGLQVLRLWLERKIFPESVLRRYMDDIGVSNDDMTVSFSLRRPSRAERSVDDPIREMEGMLVDEYGRCDILSIFLTATCIKFLLVIFVQIVYLSFYNY